MWMIKRSDSPLFYFGSISGDPVFTEEKYSAFVFTHREMLDDTVSWLSGRGISVSVIAV